MIRPMFAKVKGEYHGEDSINLWEDLLVNV